MVTSTSTADPTAQADAEFDGMRQDREQDLARYAPQATEPLKPTEINTLSAMLTRAMDAVSRGKAPDLKLERVTAPQEQLPPSVWAPFLATFGLMNELGGGGDVRVPEAKPYAADPMELAKSNAGLAEAAGLLSDMAGDNALIKALSQPMAVTSPATPTATGTPDEGAADVQGAGDEEESFLDQAAKRRPSRNN